MSGSHLQDIKLSPLQDLDQLESECISCKRSCDNGLELVLKSALHWIMQKIIPKLHGILHVIFSSQLVASLDENLDNWTSTFTVPVHSIYPRNIRASKNHAVRRLNQLSIGLHFGTGMKIPKARLKNIQCVYLWISEFVIKSLWQTVVYSLPCLP